MVGAHRARGRGSDPGIGGLGLLLSVLAQFIGPAHHARPAVHHIQEVLGLVAEGYIRAFFIIHLHSQNDISCPKGTLTLESWQSDSLMIPRPVQDQFDRPRRAVLEFGQNPEGTQAHVGQVKFLRPDVLQDRATSVVPSWWFRARAKADAMIVAGNPHKTNQLNR